MSKLAKLAVAKKTRRQHVAAEKADCQDIHFGLALHAVTREIQTVNKMEESIEKFGGKSQC
jgi:hypothetical protein